MYHSNPSCDQARGTGVLEGMVLWSETMFVTLGDLQMFVTATEVVSQETEWHPLGRASQASVQSGSSSRRSIINNSGFLAPLQVTDSELVEEEFSQVPWTVLSIGHVWKLSP